MNRARQASLFACAVVLATTVVNSGSSPGAGTPAAGPPAAGPPAAAVFTAGADAGALVPATRGSAVQLRPVDPLPPMCSAGELVRGVDTGGQKLVAFSFDDGPWPVNTRAVMTKFEKRGLRTTFFMIGRNVRLFPDIAKEVFDRGHSIGNHTMSHTYIPAQIAAEIVPTNDVIEAATGFRPTLFRSPGLTLGSVIQSTLAGQGMCNVMTDTDLFDWYMPRRPADRLCRSFVEALRPGYIALIHDGGDHTPTVDAVDCMLDAAQAQGYTVVDVPTILRSGKHYSGSRPGGGATQSTDHPAGDPVVGE